MAQGSIAAKGTVGEASARCMRGIALYLDRGGEIVAYAGGTFGVPSQWEEGVVYVVDLEQESCECGDAARRGALCKHIFAATLWAASHRNAPPFECPGSRRDDVSARRSRCSGRRAA